MTKPRSTPPSASSSQLSQPSRARTVRPRQARPERRRVGLQVKIVVGLLFISMLPLVVSAIVIDEIVEISQNYASNEAERVREPLARAAPIYRALIQSKKDLYKQTAFRFASAPEMMAMAKGKKREDVEDYLDDVLRTVPELYRVAVLSANGEVIAEGVRPQPAVSGKKYVAKSIAAPIGDEGARLRLTFAVDESLREELEQLGTHLDRFRHEAQWRSSIPRGLRFSFLTVVGGVVIVVTGAGIFMSRRLTKRIAILLDGTRRISAGNLESRVQLAGRDELAELAAAFNRMIEDLVAERRQIAYLQRVGAWQEVARKLAHEIKNPLTPIQLAVQQCVSAYKGDDDRYRRLLGDAEEIVSEEIGSLRRLVDAFRTLGQLPKVEATPMDLLTIMEDLARDPVIAGQLELDAPEGSLMVFADRLLLRRVLTNLVENGMQAGQQMDREGRVVVTWRSDDEQERVVITVDDEGPGISAQEREKIFEPYVTSKETGTGLGLTISKKIALDHGGTLEVSDQPSALGGARFQLLLPLASDDEENPDGSPPSNAGLLALKESGAHSIVPSSTTARSDADEPTGST